MKVVIAGAGAVGASIARELERRGHEVAVMDGIEGPAHHADPAPVLLHGAQWSLAAVSWWWAVVRVSAGRCASRPERCTPPAR